MSDEPSEPGPQERLLMALQQQAVAAAANFLGPSSTSWTPNLMANHGNGSLVISSSSPGGGSSSSGPTSGSSSGPSSNRQEHLEAGKGYTFEEQFKQLYELSDDPKRKEFLDDLFSFMQKKGKYILSLSLYTCQKVSSSLMEWVEKYEGDEPVESGAGTKLMLGFGFLFSFSSLLLFFFSPFPGNPEPYSFPVLRSRPSSTEMREWRREGGNAMADAASSSNIQDWRERRKNKWRGMKDGWERAVRENEESGSPQDIWQWRPERGMNENEGKRWGGRRRSDPESE